MLNANSRILFSADFRAKFKVCLHTALVDRHLTSCFRQSTNATRRNQGPSIASRRRALTRRPLPSSCRQSVSRSFVQTSNRPISCERRTPTHMPYSAADEPYEPSHTACLSTLSYYCRLSLCSPPPSNRSLTPRCCTIHPLYHPSSMSLAVSPILFVCATSFPRHQHSLSAPLLWSLRLSVASSVACAPCRAYHLSHAPHWLSHLPARPIRDPRRSNPKFWQRVPGTHLYVSHRTSFAILLCGHLREFISTYYVSNCVTSSVHQSWRMRFVGHICHSTAPALVNHSLASTRCNAATVYIGLAWETTMSALVT